MHRRWGTSMVAAAVALLVAPTGAAAAQAGDIVVSDYSAFEFRGGLVAVDPTGGQRDVLSANGAPAGAAEFNGPGQVDVEPAGTLVITNWLDDVGVLRVDPATGVRSVVSSEAVGEGPSFSTPWGVAVAPGGDILVTDDSAAAVFRVDPVTGDREVVSSSDVGSGPPFVAPWASVVDEDGDLHVVDQAAGEDFNGGVFHVDVATGDRTLVSSNSVGSGPSFDLPYSIDRESDGDLIVGDYSRPAVVRVDPVTGDRETLSSDTVGSGPEFARVSDVHVDDDGSILVTDAGPAVENGAADGVVFRVHPETGDRTVITDNAVDGEPVLVDPFGITVLPDEEPEGDYPEQVLAHEPAGYWRFGEEAGATAFDSSGNGNDGTYFGGVLLGELGVLSDDTAARLDGVNDFVRVPDAATLDVGASFTAEGWVKRSSTAKTHALFNKGGNGLHLVVMNSGAGSQVFLRRANGTTIARTSGGIQADGRFHHVVATMDGAGTARLYVDGVQDTVQVAPAATIADTTFPLTFATTGTTASTLDEFALYDRVLTPEEVAAHHAAAGGDPEQ